MSSTKDEEVHTLEELCDSLGDHQSSGRVEMETSINDILNNDTACKVTFWVTTTVHVAGYAEGYDGELPAHSLSFPFTPDEFSDMVSEADIEGCQKWDEINGEGDD